MLFSQIPRSQSWLRHLMDNDDTYSEYKFSKSNPLLDHSNPFEEGLQRLKAHDIVNAVLLFEAAVQKQADHVDVRITPRIFILIIRILPIGMALSWHNSK